MPTKTKHTAKRAPTPDEIRQIATEAVANVRTVERRLLRLPVRGKVAERVDAVLVRRGLLDADEDGRAA